MKKNHLIVVVLSIFVLFAALQNNANAAGPYICNVVLTGPALSTVYLQLTDTAATPAFTNQYFSTGTNVTNQNRILATALTAISLEKPVKVIIERVPINADDRPAIQYCFIQP